VDRIVASIAALDPSALGHSLDRDGFAMIPPLVDECVCAELAQRPRRQSRRMVVPLTQGAMAVIPVKERPVQGTRGTSRVQMRHGVSTIYAGLRRTLGLIFHDAA
jgi:hypothetical protein